MRSTPPFAEALWPEACARVAIALCKRAVKTLPEAERTPVRTIRAALDSLPPGGYPIIVSALLGLQYAILSQRKTSRQWLEHAIIASRAGCGFRRCFYDDYKAQRRLPPY